MRKDLRRRFLLASSALLATPLASLAQPQQKIRRIGLLSIDAASQAQYGLRPLIASLKRLGYEEGRNLAIERRFADGKVERLSSLAEELVRFDVQLILTNHNLATAAAKAATRTIPIVMIGSFLPVEDHLVESLARPGGNVTGTAWWDRPETADKLLQILKDAVPGATRAAVLLYSKNPSDYLSYAHFHSDEQLRNLARIGLTLQRFEITRREDIGAVLQRVAASRPDVLYPMGNPVVRSGRREIIDFAIDRKLASIWDAPLYVNDGGLLYYGPELTALLDRLASYVDRILRGARPADLPVEQSDKWELVMNSKTARAIGFKPPQSFMLRVDRTVE